MSVMDRKYINVLNCNDNCVAVQSTNGKGYLFEAGTLDEPFIIPIPSEEIVYINSVSKAFKNGVLRFEEDVAPEVYAELGIHNAENLLIREKIDEMILDPTIDAMKKIVGITDSSQIERIRGRYYNMLNNGVDVSLKVGKVITERYKEIVAGKLHSEIVVSPAEKVSDSEKQIKDLQDRIAKYDAMIEKLLSRLDAADNNESASAPVENEQPMPADDEVAKKPTRAKKARTDKSGK